MSLDTAAIGSGGVLGSLILATQAASGSFDLVATLGALGVFMATFAVAGVKIWGVVKDVNAQLSGIAKDAEERRKRAEAELEALRKEVSALREEVEALRDQADQWESDQAELHGLRETVQAQEAAIEELETRLIKAQLERDEFELLWRDATKTGKETTT